MKHAKQYFDNHDSVDKLFFTSDNLAFFDEQNAINHAQSLDDDAVTEMTRDEVYALTGEPGSETYSDPYYDPLDEPDAE